jgi:hypothetical protein
MKLIKQLPFAFFFTMAYIFVVLLVNPLGEFPLNDDWAYAQSVWVLCNKGEFLMSSWPAMTLIAQVFWGALFCKLFSLSFLSLRICTLITGLGGMLMFYQLIKKFAVNKWIGFFSMWLMFFNPLFFSLSFTFMTDVHFFSFMMCSIYFFIKYLDNRNIVFIVFATTFSIISTMIRQPGIIIPLSFVMLCLFKKEDIKIIIIASLSFLLTLISILIYYNYLHQIAQHTENIAGYSNLMAGIKTISFYQILVRSSETILYLGLFLLPILLLDFGAFRNMIINNKLKSCTILLPLMTLLMVGGLHYPSGNVLFNLGLGPKVLKDSFWNENVTPIINKYCWSILVSMLSLTGAVFIITTFILKPIFHAKKSFIAVIKEISAKHLFIFFIAIGYTILLIINASYFDRYVIPLLGTILLLIVSQTIVYSMNQKRLAICLISAMLIFSISATHDYLSWNRARWSAANYLVNELKIEPKEIDGGFEFNGWYSTGEQNPILQNEKSWWFVANDQYVISFGQINGYVKYQSYPYCQFMTWTNDSIFILKKSDH